MTFYLEAWTPREKVDQVVQRIKDSAENCCAIQLEESHGSLKEGGKKESAPTLLSNPSFLKPFQQLTTAYGLPSYDELDPSFLMAITFPPIFGLMFGDIGHGLILAIFGLTVLLLRKKAVQPSEMIRYIITGGELFLLCGIFSILSGLVFGELFGYHLSHFGIKEPPLGFILRFIPGIGEVFSPIENPIKMFKLSLLVGTACISFGIVLNLVNKLMNREFKEAFFESICWLWFYLGLIYLILFAFGVNLDLWFKHLTTVILTTILPMILMLAGESMIKGGLEGFSHFFEIVISSLGNTVSYARILALSLAHGIIAGILATAGEAGAVGLVLAMIGTIFLVMMLEGLIIFLHTVRLHWVEWFSKFYKGEGIEYKPFKLIQKYTYQKVS
jgi:V/A-type H+-transporting ATPase subunit I